MKRLIIWVADLEDADDYGAYTKSNTAMALVRLKRMDPCAVYAADIEDSEYRDLVFLGVRDDESGELWRAKILAQDGTHYIDGWCKIDDDVEIDCDAPAYEDAQHDITITYDDVIEMADSVWDGNNNVGGWPAELMRAAGVDRVSNGIFTINCESDGVFANPADGYTMIADLVYTEHFYHNGLNGEPDRDEIEAVADQVGVTLHVCDLTTCDEDGIEYEQVLLAVADNDAETLVQAINASMAEVEDCEE